MDQNYRSRSVQYIHSLGNRNSNQKGRRRRRRRSCVANQIEFDYESNMLPLCNPSLCLQSRIALSIPRKTNKHSSIITNSASSGERMSRQRTTTFSPFEARISLIFALASQATSLSQRRKCSINILLFLLVTFRFFHSAILLFFNANFFFFMWSSYS